PLYSSFLSPEAQAAIGETHELTRPARRLLEQEGFRFEGHVDIFDAGPTLESNLDDIDAVKKSRIYRVVKLQNRDGGAQPDVAASLLVCNTDSNHFSVGLAHANIGDDGIVLDAVLATALGITVGDEVRAVALRPADRA
ncbi:MAG: arginine N-succinyltransferase, partial [Pseudomonadota bacterium]